MGPSAKSKKKNIPYYHYLFEGNNFISEVKIGKIKSPFEKNWPNLLRAGMWPELNEYFSKNPPENEFALFAFARGLEHSKSANYLKTALAFLDSILKRIPEIKNEYFLQKKNNTT
jgi:hypothetical protein